MCTAPADAGGSGLVDPLRVGVRVTSGVICNTWGSGGLGSLAQPAMDRRTRERGYTGPRDVRDLAEGWSPSRLPQPCW
jgi:hypothetical protein